MAEYEAIAFLTDVSYESRLEGIKILHSKLKGNKNKSIFSDNFEISRVLAVVLFDKEFDVRIQALCFVSDFISDFQSNEDNCIHTLIPALLNCLEDPRSGVQLNAIKILKKCLVNANNFQSALEKIIIEGIYSKSKKRSLSSINKIHFIVEEYKDSSSLSRLIQALFNQLNNKHLQSAVFNALRNLSKGVDEQLFQYWCQNVPEESIKTYKLMKKTGRVPSASSNHQGKQDEPDTMREIRDYDKPPPTDAPNKLMYGFLPQSLCDKLSAKEPYLLKQEAFEEVRLQLEMNSQQPALMHHLPDFIEFLMRIFDVSNAQINSSCISILTHLITKYNSNLRTSIHTLISGLMPFVCSKISQLKDNIYKLMVLIFSHIGARDSFAALSKYLSHSKVKLRQEALNIFIIVLLLVNLDHHVMQEWVPEIFKTLLDSNRFVRQASMECCAVIGMFSGGSIQIYKLLSYSICFIKYIFNHLNIVEKIN